MADFNAKINLDADNSKALRKIEQVEKAVNKLDNAVNKVDVKVRGTQQAEQQVNKLYKALERLESSALSKLPQSLQMVIAYLKAANAGMGEFSKRALMAAAAVGDIGRVSLAPIVRAQTQAITKFNDMGGALVRVNRQIIELRNNINSLIGPIEAVSVKFINPTNFSPKLPGNIGFGGGAGTQYYGGAIGPNPQRLLGGSNQKLLPSGRLSELDKALQALGLFDAALRKAVTQVDQFGRGGTLQQGPSPAFNLGSIRALEAELRAKQALVNNAVIGSRAFKQYSRELEQTTRKLERAQSAGKGFFANLTNPQSKLGSAVIGGGFPLITGGGPGSVLGGALGGLAGGFAGSIGGSAIGQTFDQAIAKVIEVGEVTRSTGNAYEFLKEKQLFSTDAIRDRADALAEQGRVEELAALATRELVQLIGNEGVQNLNNLDDEWQELLSNITELGLAVAGFVSKFLQPVINILNNAVGGINQRNQFNALTSENADAKAFADRLKSEQEFNKRGRQTAGLSATEIREATLKKFDIAVQPESLIDVTAQDRKDFAPPSAGRAKKVRESKVPALERKLALKQKLFDIDGKIYQAEVDGDKFLVARLEGERKLAELAKDRADILAKDIPADEKKLELAINQVAVKEAQRNVEQEILDIKRQQQEYIDNLVLGNENQLELLKAETAYEKDILKIRQQADKLRADNYTEEQIAAFERSATAVAKLKQEQREYNEILQLAQGPANAFASSLIDGFRGIVEGTMSVEEAFKNMLLSMADSLAQIATKMIAEYIAIGIARAFAGMGGGGGYGTGAETPLTSGLDFSSAFGGRAGGGPVNEGLPYIVGENGPELFVPGKSGTVVNNDDFADAAAAMGAGSSSSEESGEALEMATAARGGNTSAALAGAIQAFADSGSAMATASSNRASNSAAAAQAAAMQTAESYFSAGTSTVKFDTYRVGEMDVVTREDAIKIGKQSARQAEANVYKGLKNMPAIRGRSGVK